jgi:peptide/nickel transport system substrate-binding protein
MRYREHPYIQVLKEQLGARQVGRREFLRTATLLGLSASAAYGIAGKITGEPFVASAATQMPKGGTLRIAMPIQEIAHPHGQAWPQTSNIVRQVAEYLTKTDQHNVTHPYLLERWEPSEDLRTWTLQLRKGIKWRKGRDFTADDVVWNLKHVLDPNTGSSVLGLMKSYMLKDIDTGKKDAKGKPVITTELWDANAIEKLDDHTIRLNAQVPQLAIPEHLFHYPLYMLDPEENGTFGVGSNGTGPFELVEHEVKRRSTLKAQKHYWGEGPYLDTLQFVDLGEDPAANLAALSTKQVDGLYQAELSLVTTLRALKHVIMYQVPTAQTAIVRMMVTQKPFDDPRVRQALRFATNPEDIRKISLGDLGLAAEHHHVSPVEPDYAGLPAFKHDVEKAKQLLAEAGYANGIDLELVCPNSPQWQSISIQALVQQWKGAGIRTKISIVPAAEYWNVWDKIPLGSTLWEHRPLGVMLLALAYRTGVPWNETHFSNSDFDRLLTEAEGILDTEKRREVMAKLEKILQDDGPLVQPFWNSMVTFYDKRVKGFRPHPTTYIFGNELAIES